MPTTKRVLMILIGVALLLVPTLAFASGSGEEADGETGDAPVTLRLAHVQAERSPAGIGTERFAELANEYSGGTITIEVFPASQLGSNAEIFSSVQTGAVDMSITPYPLMADIVPEFMVYVAGYFFEDHDQQLVVLNHPDYGQTWNQQLEDDGGLRVVGNFLYGARNLTTTDTPVYGPEDLSGLRLRAVPNPMSLSVAEGLGGEPTSVAFAELFEALRQGVVDAQENPLPTIAANNFDEVQTYLMLTEHQLITLPWVINIDSYNGLSAAQQEALVRAATEAATYTTELTNEAEATLVDQLVAGGMTVIGPEDGLQLDVFRSRVQANVQEAFAPTWSEGLTEEILALIN